MPTAEDLINDPCIQKFLNTHQSCEDEVKRAAKQLADKPDALIALNKLLPAFNDRAIKVFFSYKTGDEATAKKVVNLLRLLSNQLKITFQAEFTKDLAGQPWRTHIRDSIQEANWFILLLPDPKDDWDWCLYEAGLFESQRTSADRLICLHHPDKIIPPQIDDYQAVTATESGIEDFLNMTFIKDNPVCGMKALSPNLIPEVQKRAQEIKSAILPPKEDYITDIFEPYIELELGDINKLNASGDLDNLSIGSANRASLELFGRIVKPSTFGELRKFLPKNDNINYDENDIDDRWRQELYRVVRRLSQDRTYSPIQSVFLTDKGKMYRPNLYAVNRSKSNGIIKSVSIAFIEEIGVADYTAMPADAASLVSILRLVFRFRWEVLEKFSYKDLTEGDVERLETSMKRIEIDAESRGLNDEQAYSKYFSPDQLTRISEMFVSWSKVRTPDGTGELDNAIKAKDLDSIQKILRSILPLNQEFLQMASERFHTIVTKDSLNGLNPAPSIGQNLHLN